MNTQGTNVDGGSAGTQSRAGESTAMRVERRELPAPYIAPEGRPIIGIFVAVSALIVGASWYFGGGIGGGISGFVCLVLTGWCNWFFRDPQRVLPLGKNDVICPADGRVVIVDEAVPPEELGLDAGKMQRICIFMNVFNVHVNRAPVEGVVEKVSYRPGKFFNASFDKASVLNERSSLLLKMADGRRVVCVQIAGLVARRIVCRVKEGVKLSGGERFGIIRFGSRVDVYLPMGSRPTVKIGDMTQAGSTVIAQLEG